MHGTADELIPPVYAELTVSTLRQLGMDVKMYECRGSARLLLVVPSLQQSFNIHLRGVGLNNSIQFHVAGMDYKDGTTPTTRSKSENDFSQQLLRDFVGETERSA